jgi:tetratricopeptide (TPR) repeat protein
MSPPSRARTSLGQQTTQATEISWARVPPGRAATSSPLPAGATLGERYEVSGVLGSGGFAFVYRALDRELAREVALKVLHADRLTPEALSRFRREAGLARDTTSERLVRIFDIGRCGDAVFLTMEIVAGGSLDRCLASGPLPVDEAARIAAQALEGLDALHALQIVHRDVKPGNVLLTANGEVKLADFGLARQLGEDESRLTRDGALLGTLQYLSPEQALGEEVGPGSDLYSLGVVLFEMLTGRLPHEGRSALGTLLGHLQEEAPDVRTFRPEVPAWLAGVVARLLARLPAARYPSAAAALADLAARRGPAIRRAHRGKVLGAALLALVAGAAPLAWRGWNAHRFSHLVDRPAGGSAAISGSGEVLWTAPLAKPSTFALARLHPYPWSSRVLVGVLDPSGTPVATHTLSVLDPENGRVLQKVLLPSGADHFPGFADDFHPTVDALDLDGDGADEIVVNYRHGPWWPNYVVLYEPRIGRPRIVFFGSGHHHFAGAADLDGDGRPELVFAGINNRMGWYTGVAAVRLVPPVNVLEAVEQATASSPDRTTEVSSPRSLLWYALGPRERLLDSFRPCRIDPAARRIECAYTGGVRLRLGFDGFPVDRPSPRPAGERRAAREGSYRELREAGRLLAGDDPADALPPAERAIAQAEQTGDRRLLDWAERLHASILVAAGRLAEGEGEFARLAASSEAASDVCYDAGKALHLAGALAPAVAWYRRGLGRGGSTQAGRAKWEFLEGEVLALTELKRFAEARGEIERFVALYPDDNAFLEIYRRYVSWREGAVPSASGLDINEGSPDVLRYFRLELRFAAGTDPRQMLQEIAAELPHSSEAAAELLSLEGEVLARLGRRTEARRAAQDAYELALQKRREITGVRAHFGLIAARAARLAHAAGG